MMTDQPPQQPYPQPYPPPPYLQHAPQYPPPPPGMVWDPHARQWVYLQPYPQQRIPQWGEPGYDPRRHGPSPFAHLDKPAKGAAPVGAYYSGPASTAHGFAYWVFVGWWLGPMKFAGRIFLWIVFPVAGAWRSLVHGRKTDRLRERRGFRSAGRAARRSP